jgi:biotin transport system permease protein
MLTLTSPVETPLHRVAAGVKLGLLAVFTATLFALQTPPTLGLAALIVGALYAAGGIRFIRHGVRMLRPVWPFVVIVAVWHAVTGDIAGGALVVARMVTAIAAANLVTMTTRLSDMISLIERLSAPLSPVLPPRRLALAIALVIRFIPVLSDRVTLISEAYRARSPRRPRWRILAPAALAALDDADHVAEALRARGGAG